MKRITLGQYYPADSAIHRMDPRAKIILAILYIVCSFLAKNVISFAVLFASGFVLILFSKIPLRMILKSMRPVIFLLLFTVVINIFWTTADEEPLVAFSFIRIYQKGIYNAVFMMIRIFSLILGSGIFLTYTSTPISLTYAIEKLLKPLTYLHVPVHEFAMMMTTALRFIPPLAEETDRIMSAQKARGADFESGNLLRRAKALLPILVPLLVSSFNHADELATAMECRCYHGGKGRTRMNQLHFRVSDALALVLMALFGVGIVVLNRMAIGYTL